MSAPVPRGDDNKQIIRLSHLPMSISADILEDSFKDAGPIREIIIKSTTSGHGPVTSAEITFDSAESAKNAVIQFQQTIESRLAQIYQVPKSVIQIFQVQNTSMVSAQIPSDPSKSKDHLGVSEFRMTIATPDRCRKCKVVFPSPFMVRFAIIPACNALGIPYRRTMGLYRVSNEKTIYDPWILPGARLPVHKLTENEIFEIKDCPNPDAQSNVSDVLTIAVLDASTGRRVDIMISRSSMCFMIPLTYGHVVRSPEMLKRWYVCRPGDPTFFERNKSLADYGIAQNEEIVISPTWPIPTRR